MDEQQPSHALASNRRFGLDVMRALAITLVVLVHYRHWFNAQGAHVLYDPLPDGVDLFFALSGFLVGGIWLREANRGKLNTLKSGLHFLGRRWYRTLPNYYLFLGLNLLLAFYEIPIRSILTDNWPSYFWFGQNLITGTTGFFHESWSLAVEEWFYVLLVAMGLIAIAIKPKTIHVKWLTLGIALVLIAGPMLWRLRVPLQFATDLYLWDDLIHRTAPRRLDAIGWGVLAAWVLHFAPQMFHRIRWWGFGVGVLLLIIDPIVFLSGTAAQVYMGHLYFLQQAVGCALLLPIAYALPTPSGNWVKGVEGLSRVSYSLYLVHFTPLLLVVEQFVAPPDTYFTQITWGILYFAVSILAATGVYYAWERPWLRLRDRQLRPKN